MSQQPFNANNSSASGAGTPGGPSGPSYPGGPGIPGGPGQPGGPIGSANPNQPGGPATPQPAAGPQPIAAPTLTNGATIYGRRGTAALRHPVEMPLVYIAGIFLILGYITWVIGLIWYMSTQGDVEAGTADAATQWLHEQINLESSAAQFIIALPVIPFVIWIARAFYYAEQRATAVQMSPTQFPEGYRMVAEAAAEFGLRRIPDAYVLVGNGTINAFAAGHGFRRYVVIYSDLFEVGGKARDPEALRFVISHEVGHIAAGHTSFTRIFVTQVLNNIPLLGQALSRAQEYTADNHGYAVSPQGAAGAMGLLSAGKYLGPQVNFHALADRAAREKGLWLHLVAWLSSHPINTWRANALRDRSRPGKIMIRPADTTAQFPAFQPAGSLASGAWPTPQEVLTVLGRTVPATPGEEQFGRYPGVHYAMPVEQLHLADPTPRFRDVPAAHTAEAGGPSGAPETGPVNGPTPDDGQAADGVANGPTASSPTSTGGSNPQETEGPDSAPNAEGEPQG